MMLGLAVALYWRGSYDQAEQRFFEAADLNPSDPTPYLFLCKVSTGAITESKGFVERVERFARLHPENAWANYYYAVSLWRQRRGQEDAAAASKVRALLQKAVRLNPQLGLPFLQLGTVYADEGNLLGAIAAYKSAIDASPSLEEAHYRMAQAYRKTGKAAKAQKELELYQKMSRESAQALERERSEIQQFVFALKGQAR
jgi:tetratricopeptide (TPR) repeat protein